MKVEFFYRVEPFSRTVFISIPMESDISSLAETL